MIEKEIIQLFLNKETRMLGINLMKKVFNLKKLLIVPEDHMYFFHITFERKSTVAYFFKCCSDYNNKDENNGNLRFATNVYQDEYMIHWVG